MILPILSIKVFDNIFKVIEVLVYTMKRGKYRKGVFIVVYRRIGDKAEYLLLKRRLHWRGWEFCKGGIKGAGIKASAIREVHEETGLKIKKLKKHNKAGKYRYSKELPDRQGFIGQTYSLFSAEVGKGRVSLDKEYQEHSGYKWVSAQQALKMLKWPNQRACLRLVSKAIK